MRFEELRTKVITLFQSWITILIVVICISIFYLLYRNYSFTLLIAETTSYYFFSTLLQINTTIISIIGVFAIFYINQMLSTIASIKKKLQEYHGKEEGEKLVIEFENLPQLEKYGVITDENSKDSAPEKFLKQNWYVNELKIYFMKSKILNLSVAFLFLALKDIILLLSPRIFSGLRFGDQEWIMALSLTSEVLFLSYTTYFIVFSINKTTLRYDYQNVKKTIIYE